MRPEGHPAGRIRLFFPKLSQQAIAAVGDVLRSGWIGLGPRVREFELAFASYVGARHCAAVDSATSGLHLALRILDVPEGAEVITTPVTFVAPSATISYVGATPVFADIDPTTGNLEPASICNRLTAKTAAILVVHYAGMPCALDQIDAIAADAGTPLVEDCAHAAGASYRGCRIGSRPTLQVFSFGALKNLAIGRGGAVTTPRSDHDHRLRRLRAHGIERASDGTRLTKDPEIVEVGYRYEMHDVDAAIGLAQLDQLDAQNQRRTDMVALYRRLLEGVPGITLLRQPTDRSSSNWIFCVLAEERDSLARKLDEAGIDTDVHFRPNSDLGPFPSADVPNADWFAARQLSLPLHLDLNDDDIEYVAQTIRSGW